jgi:hypothetical protein
MMTAEQRLGRTERILLDMARSGRRSRSEFRYKINSLIDAQIRHEAEWRAESRDLDEKIKVMVDTQKEAGEQIKALAAGHAKAEQESADLKESVQAFIDSLRKGYDGGS